MSKSSNNTGKAQDLNNQRSNVHNPNSLEHKAAADNKSNQKNPNLPNPKSKIKQGKYEFKPNSFIEIRNQIGLTQNKMADVLGVPANTLSRWEKGLAVPDAASLAAIFSVAKERGITPGFFRLRGEIIPFKYNLVSIWDFQTTGIPAPWVQYAHNTIMTEIGKRFSEAVPIYKAFAHPSQQEEKDVLEALGWSTRVGEDEIFDDIVNQVKSDCGHNPERTGLFLVTRDDSFVELVDALMGKGVSVFVMSPNVYHSKLIERVGQANSIFWYPVSLEPPKRVTKEYPTWAGRLSNPR